MNSVCPFRAGENLFLLLFSYSFAIRPPPPRVAKRVNLREDTETVTGLPSNSVDSSLSPSVTMTGPEPRLSKYRRVIARVWSTGRP